MRACEVAAGPRILARIGSRLFPGLTGLILAAGLLAIEGCGSKPDVSLEPADVPRTTCVVLPGVPVHAGPINVALTEEVDPEHAPDPRNDAERLVFRQLYETLIRVDCAGLIRPGLAWSWACADSGRCWTLTLRPDARFWDGSPVLAQDVRSSWLAARNRAEAEGTLYPWAWIKAVAWTGPQDRTIAVFLNVAQENLPPLFAHPALAVARASSTSEWPLGTGPCRVFPPGGWGEGTFVCGPNPHYPDSQRPDDAGQPPEIWFRVRRDADPRDLLSAGADLLLVRDRAILEYTLNVPGYVSTPLPWDRIYVLASPLLVGMEPGALDGAKGVVAQDSISLRSALASDVVSSDARPACTFSFEEETGSAASGKARCEDAWDRPGRAAAARPGGRGRRRDGLSMQIVYTEGDADGERLAGRFAALARSGGASLGSPASARASPLFRLLFGENPENPPVVSGLQPKAFRAALRKGKDVAYILALRRTVPNPCPEREAILGSLALVATRAHLVSRQGLAAVRVDWDGTLLFNAAGWEDTVQPGHTQCIEEGSSP